MSKNNKDNTRIDDVQVEERSDLTWWEQFQLEYKDNKAFSKIFEEIDKADKKLTEESLAKVIRYVYAIDKEQYPEVVANFDKKIKIFEKRLDRQLGDNFGSILRHAREKKGLSLAKLGKISGISSSYINRIELGDRKSPSYAIIETLANALEIPVAELLNIGTQQTDKGEIKGIAEMILSNDVAYTDGGEKIEKKKKEQLVEIIEYLLEIEWKNQKHVESIKLMGLIDDFKAE